MTKHRRKYDQEFKRNAVLLTLEEGRSVQEISENLGVSRDLLYQWRRNHKALGDIAFPGNGRPALTPEQHRIRELEKQLKDTEMERDILKKAMAIFSRAQ